MFAMAESKPAAIASALIDGALRPISQPYRANERDTVNARTSDSEIGRHADAAVSNKLPGSLFEIMSRTRLYHSYVPTMLVLFSVAG